MPNKSGCGFFVALRSLASWPVTNQASPDISRATLIRARLAFCRIRRLARSVLKTGILKGRDPQMMQISKFESADSASAADPLPRLLSKEMEKEEMRENRCAGTWHSTPLALFCVPCPSALRGHADPFDLRRHAHAKPSGMPPCRTQRTRPQPVAARLYASTAPGPGPCPGSKVRTPFEDAHRISKVRILENPDDFFEGAHPFARCAQKTAHLRRNGAREVLRNGCLTSNQPCRKMRRKEALCRW